MSDEDGVWKALARSHRRAILRLVRDGERTAGDIAATFDITRPAVSQHLSALKEAGLLRERRDGTRRLYRANKAALREVASWLRSMDAVPERRASSGPRPTPAPRPARRHVVEEEVTLDLHPASTWRLLANPEVRARWKGAPEPEVVEVDKGVHVRWRWRWEAGAEPADVQVRLRPAGRASEVLVRHEGPGGERWARYLERLQAVARGWDPGPEEQISES